MQLLLQVGQGRRLSLDESALLMRSTVLGRHIPLPPGCCRTPRALRERRTLTLSGSLPAPAVADHWPCSSREMTHGLLCHACHCPTPLERLGTINCISEQYTFEEDVDDGADVAGLEFAIYSTSAQ